MWNGSPCAALFQQVQHCTEYFIQVIFSQMYCLFGSFKFFANFLKLFSCDIARIFISHFFHRLFFPYFTHFFLICKDSKRALRKSKMGDISSYINSDFLWRYINKLLFQNTTTSDFECWVQISKIKSYIIDL